MQTDVQPEAEKDAGRMSLGAHLDELRIRIGLALGGFVAAFCVSLAAGKWFAGIILSPYAAAMESAGIEVKLQAVQPAEPFLVYVKAALVLAALLSSPWVFYQLWAFVAAGLHRHERRFVRIVAPACALLFAGGVLFFLLAIAPWIFRFFMQFDLGIDYLTYQPAVGQTADFMLTLATVFVARGAHTLFGLLGGLDSGAGLGGLDATAAAVGFFGVGLAGFGQTGAGNIETVFGVIEQSSGQGFDQPLFGVERVCRDGVGFDPEAIIENAFLTRDHSASAFWWRIFGMGGDFQAVYGIHGLRHLSSANVKT